MDVRESKIYDLKEFRIDNGYEDDLEGILVPSEQVEKKIQEIAYEINTELGGCDDLCVVYLEKGAEYFKESLKRYLEPEILQNGIEGIEIGSYDGTESGEIEKGDSYHEFIENLKGKKVLGLEDIIDTGSTLNELDRDVSESGADSLTIACLCDKPNREKEEPESLKYKGFILPDNAWVVGRGMDYNGEYRDLRHICILKPEIYGE